jgi:hypothetical protein
LIATAGAVALWFIPPVLYYPTEEGNVYLNTGWIPISVLSGYAIGLPGLYMLWQAIKYFRSRAEGDRRV